MTNYVSQTPPPTIEIIKLYCPGGGDATIAVGDPSTVPPGSDNGTATPPSTGTGCTFGNAIVTVTNDATGQVIFSGSVGDDGILVLQVEAGVTYTVTETAPGQVSTMVTVPAGNNVKVIIRNPQMASMSPSASASASESAPASAFGQ